MKIISFHSNLNCFIPIVLTVVFSCLLGSQDIFAQSVIYKSDGTQIKAIQVSKEGNTIMYKLPGDTTNILHYLSLSSIDSIRYENGTLERLHSDVILPDINKPEIILRKNFVGINIWPLFQGRIHAFYERRFSNNKYGFKNHFYYSKNNFLNDGLTDYNFETGLNRYFLNSDWFRIGTGFSFQHGEYEDFSYYDYYSNGYYEYEEKKEKNKYNTLNINGSFSYILEKRIYISIEVDIPLFLPTNYHNFQYFRTEIALNF